MSDTEKKLQVQEASEASAFTYNEYDTNTDEDGQGQLIDLSTPEISRRHLPPSLMPLSENESGRSSVNSRPDFTDEENYEDFGVGEDLESDTSDPNHSGSDKFSKSRRRDPASSKHHRHRGPNKRVSSAVYASQLQRSAINATEDILDDIDGSFHALNDRVRPI
ncbi:hypothetical protein CHS0354_033136 [Potamilus streckersoni]|uniref:Uncharacterized protein n=1 Tax=Potamilus streckersoni TaxID=2493646 RepID=A0AAE0S6Y4_9BIVA|nr:hypothetical protein CHS0354_033136 [Potamilus streckersoni]